MNILSSCNFLVISLALNLEMNFLGTKTWLHGIRVEIHFLEAQGHDPTGIRGEGKEPMRPS
jgi:hypothetical protein